MPASFVSCSDLQPETKLLILCQNGIVVQVPAPDPMAYDAVTTYRIKDLPAEYFRFGSIKSRILVKYCSNTMENLP